MEMVYPNWLVWIGVASLWLLIIGGILALMHHTPTPENRPAPPSRRAANETRRHEALARHEQRQREASARLTRG